MVSVLIDEVLWPSQPLGRDVAGSKDSVNGIRRQQMLDYLQRQYSPRNTVVSVAGNVSHDQVVQAAQRHFGSWRPAPTGESVGATVLPNGERLRVRYK